MYAGLRYHLRHAKSRWCGLVHSFQKYHPFFPIQYPLMFEDNKKSCIESGTYQVTPIRRPYIFLEFIEAYSLWKAADFFSSKN